MKIDFLHSTRKCPINILFYFFDTFLNFFVVFLPFKEKKEILKMAYQNIQLDKTYNRKRSLKTVLALSLLEKMISEEIKITRLSL